MVAQFTFYRSAVLQCGLRARDGQDGRGEGGGGGGGGGCTRRKRCPEHPRELELYEACAVSVRERKRWENVAEAENSVSG